MPASKEDTYEAISTEERSLKPARPLTIPRLKKYIMFQVASLVQIWSPFFSTIKVSSDKCKIVSFAIGKIYHFLPPDKAEEVYP